MKTTTKSTTNYLRIFESVVPAYQERQHSSGTMKSATFSQSSGTGSATHTGGTCFVRPLDGDFLADVELAALRSLTSGQHAYWITYYQTCKVIVVTEAEKNKAGYDADLEEHVSTFPANRHEAVRSLDTKMREQMGRRFKDVGIHPLSLYLKPVDVRARGPRTEAERAEHSNPLSPSYNPFWASDGTPAVGVTQ